MSLKMTFAAFAMIATFVTHAAEKPKDALDVPEGWTSDYKQAKEKAKQTKKPILWIQNSIDIYTKSFFLNVVPKNADLLKNYICCVENVELGKEPEDVKKATAGITRMEFPLILILSSEGKALSVATETSKYMKDLHGASTDNGVFKKELEKHQNNN